MGDPKGYLPLATSDKETIHSTSTAATEPLLHPPPPYENKKELLSLRWKILYSLLLLVGLFLVGFLIHPVGTVLWHKKGMESKNHIALGLPLSQHQLRNRAQKELKHFMTSLVQEGEHSRHLETHHHRHKHHHHHHEQHSNGNDKDKANTLPNDSHHPHHHHHHHHRHHHQKEQQKQHEKRQTEDDTVYVQKLPTHNRYRPPTLNHQQRDKIPAEKSWTESYHWTPTEETKICLVIRSLQHPHQHQAAGNVTLRQDTTGMQQDAVITFTTDSVSSKNPAYFSYRSDESNIMIDVAFKSKQIDTALSYSVDIVLPSHLKRMKSLSVHINNGTIYTDDSLTLDFKSITLAAVHGSIVNDNIAADHILLGTYSGDIKGSYQPAERFAAATYRGNSNIHLAPSSRSARPDRLHIACASTHGTSELSLAYNVFKGQFDAHQSKQGFPRLNFTLSHNESHGYESLGTLLPGFYTGWYMEQANAGLLNIHGRNGVSLQFK